MVYTEYVEFQPWPKIPRLKGNGIVITEKIDGTNSQVVIQEDGSVLVGSRNRYITPDDDNFGFARFVHENVEAFRKLGPGRHYGEWWGPGIQRGYAGREKIFSLFNIRRHDNVSETTGCDRIRTVPVLYTGEWHRDVVDTVMADLERLGSQASPGFLRPEGIVLFHCSSRQLFKYTLEGDKKEGLNGNRDF